MYAVTIIHCTSLQAFANYLAYKRDNNELLLFILRQLAGDHLNFNRNRYGGEVDIIEVPEDEFAEKVCAIVVYLRACTRGVIKLDNHSIYVHCTRFSEHSIQRELVNVY